MNLYIYVGNNPVLLVDPWGLCRSGSGFHWSSAITWDWGDYFRDVGAHYKGIITAPGDYYHTFRSSGLGVGSSVLQSANMSLGKVVGYSTLLEGAVGIDVRTNTLLPWGGWSGRGARIGFGTVQTATFAVAASNTLHAGGGGGLTTPNKFYGTRTASQAENALKAKYGPPTYTDPARRVWYNSGKGRSIVIHNEAGNGAIHIDITRRGGYTARKIILEQ